MKTVFMNYPRLGKVKINGVYSKGKKGVEKRIHITQLSTNQDMILWLEDYDNFRGRPIGFTNVNVISPAQLKQQRYNYYLDASIDEDKYFDQMMRDFVSSDPLIPASLTSKMHTKYSKSAKYPIYY